MKLAVTVLFMTTSLFTPTFSAERSSSSDENAHHKIVFSEVKSDVTRAVAFCEGHYED